MNLHTFIHHLNVCLKLEHNMSCMTKIKCHENDKLFDFKEMSDQPFYPFNFNGKI